MVRPADRRRAEREQFHVMPVAFAGSTRSRAADRVGFEIVEWGGHETLLQPPRVAREVFGAERGRGGPRAAPSSRRG